MYYAGEPYDSVLRQLKAVLGEPEFFVRLTGKQGSGKSALLEQIVSYYTEQGYLTRYFPINPDSPMALRSALRKSFGMEKAHNFQRSLQEHLAGEALLHKGIVLIFDDCHLMNNATLLELTKLTDIQINHSCMLSIVMSANETLDDRLNLDHELRPVLQRITLSTHLPAMDKKASALFLRKFFDAADQQDLRFDASAQALLYDVSKGLPQYLSEIAGLCSNLYRAQELSSTVRKSDLAKVLKHPSLAPRRLSRKRPAPSRKIMVSAAAAAGALTLLATAWITLLPTAPTETAPLSPITTDTAVVDNLADLSREILPTVALIDEPDADPAPLTQPINQPAFETVAEIAAETVPETTSETAAENATETTAEIAAETAPETTPVTTAETVAETTADTVAQTSAEPATASTPELVVDTVPEQTAASTPGLFSPEQTLQNWLAAWQSRNVDAYFSFYHSEFFPRGFDSVTTWQENRRRNIGNREWIEMQVSELSVNNIAERVTELQFWLSYQSPGYSDRTRKQIIMRLTDDGWQITQEINLEIIYL